MTTSRDPISITEYRGHALGITPNGHFTIDQQPISQEHDTFAKAKAYIDRISQQDAKNINQQLAIPAIRSDGERTTVTGLNRSNGKPTTKKVPPPNHSTTLDNRDFYFDHPWVEPALQERDKTAKRLRTLDLQLRAAMIRGPNSRRIEPEDYPKVIDHLLQQEQQTRNGPPPEED